MKITTKLRLSAITTILLIIVFIAAVFSLTSQLRHLYEKQQLAEKVAEGAFKAALLRNEYVAHPGERSKTQWVSVHGAESRLLNQSGAPFSSVEEAPLFDDIRRASANSKALFEDLVRNIEEGGNEVAVQDLSRELALHAQARVSSALRLTEISRADAKRAGRTLNLAVIVLGIFIAGIALVSYFASIPMAVDLERTIKMKTEFISLAAHELRIPLATSQWYIKMLLGDKVGKVNKREKSYVREIETANLRMAEIMDVLLNVSRIELGVLAIHPTMSNATDILRTSVKNVERRAKEKSVSLTLKFGKNIPQMNIDTGLFDTIATNLITNSIKYTPKGGSVEVEFGIQKGRAVLVVQDSGIGIKAGDAKKIFTKFYRAENAKAADTQGVGLGLYIIKSIVDKTGGEIRFESPARSSGGAENKGATFFVSYPQLGMRTEMPGDVGKKHVDDFPA